MDAKQIIAKTNHVAINREKEMQRDNPPNVRKSTVEGQMKALDILLKYHPSTLK